MEKYRSSKHLRYAAWAAAIAIVLATVPARAPAQEAEEDSIWNLDRRIYRGLMDSLGVKTEKEAIDYRERSPLVLPGGRDLPRPQTAAAQPPAWPVDPDVKRRREAAKKKYDARFSREEHRGEILAPSALDGGNRPGGGGGSGGRGPNAADARESGNSLLPSSLGYVGGLFSWSGFGFGPQKDDTVAFDKEPPRTSLFEPPPGYQTPSPAQPYGMGKRKDTTPIKRPEDRVVD
jgi:hypothetical protein